MQDLKQKFINLNASEEKVKLTKLEEKLKALLSLDKKVELELNDIENMI